MKSVLFVCSSAFLGSSLLFAQSAPLIQTHQPGVLADAQARPVPAFVAPTLGALPPPSFTLPLPYNSGGNGNTYVAVADVNRDGNPDLLVASSCGNNESCNQGGTVGVLLSNGDGTFQPPVNYGWPGYYQSFSLAVADVNRDGNPDLLVLGNEPGGGAVVVLLGNGDGTFQPGVDYDSGGYLSSSLALADVNRDGNPDLLVTSPCYSPEWCSNGVLSVLLGNGDGTFQSAATFAGIGLFNDYAPSMAVGDLNGDRQPDLVVAMGCSSFSGNNCQVGVLLGNPDGTFQAPVPYRAGGYGPSSVALSDVNGDGNLDIVVANICQTGSNCDNGTLAVLLGNGDGTFQKAKARGTGGFFPESVVVADVNGDGKPDLLVANCGGACSGGWGPTGGIVSVLLGNGDGTFNPPIIYGAGGLAVDSLAVADINGDGRPDIVVANYFGYTSATGVLGVMLNQSPHAATSTSLVSSSNPAQLNQSVTFTATVTSSTAVPNGSAVAFYANGIEIGTGTTTNGVASLTVSFPKATTYSVKAKYSRDPFHAASSSTLKQVVTLTR